VECNSDALQCTKNVKTIVQKQIKHHRSKHALNVSINTFSYTMYMYSGTMLEFEHSHNFVLVQWKHTISSSESDSQGKAVSTASCSMYFLRNSSTILVCGEVFDNTRGYSNSRRCGVVPKATKNHWYIQQHTVPHDVKIHTSHYQQLIHVRLGLCTVSICNYSINAHSSLFN